MRSGVPRATELGTVTTGNGLHLNLFGVAGGAIWLRANANSGINALIRVTAPGRP